MRVEVELGDRALVIDDGVLERHRRALEGRPAARAVRRVLAAAHLALESGRAGAGGDLEERVDWRATRAIRRRLDELGFGVAEAMDTAQRFRLPWPVSRRLIEECGALGLRHGFVAGAGADHLTRIESEARLVDGVVEQARLIQAAGGEVVLLPLPWLVERGAVAADYVRVYGAIVRQLEGPVYVHWLGEAFAPGLAGYFPGDSFERVMALEPAVVRGAKLSLLDPERERRLRRVLLGREQLLLTGDDLHFADLIAGDGRAPECWTRVGTHEVALGDFSHALLGAFDAVAEPASLALRHLAAGDRSGYFELMRPAERLARAIFEPPTRHYRAGLAFVAWLNGLQDNAMLLGGEERERGRSHYLRVAELAAACGALRDARLAADRLRALLA